MKLLAPFLLALGVCHACDCFEPRVQSKRDHADLIFRGTIVELRDSSTPAGIKTVVFRVSRVWKGNVGQTFEMPGIEETSACIGL